MLPPALSRIHQIFHASKLRKYITDPSHVLQPWTVELNKDLTYEEYPMEIVNRQVRQLCTKDILMVKVLWGNHTAEDCTWVIEVMMQVAYPLSFPFLICTSFIY